jgi:transcription elongation factor GreA
MEKKVFTAQGLNKLKEELEYLQTTKRKEVADRIKVAKEYGDLSENSEYQDAKEEQAFVEGRVIELEHMVKTAIIAEEGGSNDSVRVGSQVTVDKAGQKFNFTIVGSTEADPINGKISLESPLGQAMLNHKVGEEFEVDLPSGKVTYKITNIA